MFKRERDEEEEAQRQRVSESENVVPSDAEHWRSLQQVVPRPPAALPLISTNESVQPVRET